MAGRNKGLDEAVLEGGVGGGMSGGFRASKAEKTKSEPSMFDRLTGSKAAKDYKEKDYSSEMSGNINFGSPRRRDYDSGDRSPRTSDDYAKGGMTASKRADGIAQRGKTKGTMVACGGGYMKGKK